MQLKSFIQALRLLATILLLSPFSLATQSWAGSSLYYAAGLTTAEQHTLFSGLQSANVQVLRVWLDGQNAPAKGTAITSFPSLEPNTVGQFDDTVLNRLDDFMVNAAAYGIKLMVSIYSFNSLQANDAYGRWYGTGNFYTDSNAISYFQQRIWHVLYHVNPHNGKAWKDCSEYIFAFEAQNEAMNNDANFLAAHAGWQCTMATTIKSALGSGNNGILVTTGGGGWVDVSMQPSYFTCAALDVIAIHAYGVGDFTYDKLAPYVAKAQQYGKKLIMQEWGACYYDTPNNRCNPSTPLAETDRANNFRSWADQISQSGIPWMYWQILPNNDPHGDWDYEIGIGDTMWSTFQTVASGTAHYQAAFDFSPWLPSSTAASPASTTLSTAVACGTS